MKWVLGVLNRVQRDSTDGREHALEIQCISRACSAKMDNLRVEAFSDFAHEHAHGI